jgi:uncharacterized protein (DUF1499 family)
MRNRAQAEREFAATPGAIAGAVDRAIGRLGWETSSSGDAMRHAVWTSPVFRFQDDVAITWRPSDGGTAVRVDSASRVGRYDFGQNARHVRRLFEAVEKELGER